MKMFRLTMVIIILVWVVSSISCVNKDTQVTEIYTDTEQRQESYTASEQYEIKTPHSNSLYPLENKVTIPDLCFLFNSEKDGTVKWVSDFTTYPDIRTFKIVPEGKNHRISIKMQLDSLVLDRDAPRDYTSDKAVYIGLVKGRGNDGNC